MAEKSNALPVNAQVAAVRQILLDDPSLTLTDIQTNHPDLTAGVRAILEEGANPERTGSGSAPMTPFKLGGTI